MSAFSSRYTYPAVFLLISSIGGYSYYKKQKNEKAFHHPARETIETIVRMDNRVNNFLGRQFKITNYEITSEDNFETVFKFKISGIRGKCQLIGKCNKMSHKSLKEHNEAQKKYSQLSPDDKSVSVFSPINFNDPLIPDEKASEKIKALASGDEKLINDQIISDTDLFYRISSIIVSSADKTFYINVRPIAPKYRSFNIEDTVYNNETYSDVLNKISTLKKNLEKFKSETSEEHLRNELKTMKKNDFEKKLQMRKIITVANMILYFGAFFLYVTFRSHKIDALTYNFLRNKIESSGRLKGYNLTCISYRYNPFANCYVINGLMQNENGNFGLKTKTIGSKLNESVPVIYYELKKQ
jgi:hypothetical protein